MQYVKKPLKAEFIFISNTQAWVGGVGVGVIDQPQLHNFSRKSIMRESRITSKFYKLHS